MSKGKKRNVIPTGIGTDATGGPLIDPTQNVKDLTEAANIRQDDLRRETNRRIDSEINHIKRILKQDRKNQRELRKAEAFRLNSIRQVDREEVNKLATATNNTAETLRTTVSTTAQQHASNLANSMGEINKRISALELSSSAGGGQSQGAKNMWGYVAAAITLIIMVGMAMITLGGIVVGIAYAIRR